ncbi:MAG: signal peptidase I [Bacteroidia bacterium]
MLLIRKITAFLFWAFLLWLFFRIFIFQIYRIPSSSMQGTLQEGDMVLVNKMAYGPRLPVTPLSLSIFGEKKYISWTLPYYRLFGYSQIKRNDVIVFNYPAETDEPIDMREEYIKRCVALPGDTLRIENGRIMIGSLPLSEPEHLLYSYIITGAQPLGKAFLNYTEGELSEDGRKLMCFLTKQAADSVAKLSGISSVSLNAFPKNYYTPAVFPHHSSVLWNYDFFGPLWVPQKGDSILLNERNLLLYQSLIIKHEQNTLTARRDSFFVNGRASVYYRFNQNYFFTLGDNRHNSTDSRAWGFVPESHIIGKAELILHSPLKKGRTFLKIN